MTSEVTYTGHLRTRCRHINSGDEYITDAPLDNNGRGEAFSPTDTVATAMANCMFTVMGIKARDLDIDLTGATAMVTKVMASGPRRISEIKVEMNFPVKVNEKTRKTLEHTAKNCPVCHSLHPDIKKETTFNWLA